VKIPSTPQEGAEKSLGRKTGVLLSRYRLEFFTTLRIDLDGYEKTKNFRLYFCIFIPVNTSINVKIV